jgi:cytochrome P450
MGTADQLHSYPPAVIVAGLFVSWIVYLVALAAYRLYLSPLARFPGPKLAASSILPKLWYQAAGSSVRWITALHQRYGPIVRVGPNELSFTDAQAFQDIYGFKPPGKPANDKDPKFYDFASLEDRSIINAYDADHSRTRRVFSHAFSDKALREQQPLLMKYIDLMGVKMKEMVEREPDAKVDMVKMLNFTTFDIMGMFSPPPF